MLPTNILFSPQRVILPGQRDGSVLKEWFRAAFGRGAGGDEYARKLEPYLADGNACALLRLVLENPGITLTALAGRAQLTGGATGAFLKRLMTDGLVVAGNEDGQAGYHIAGAAKAAVVERLPLNYQCPGLKRE